MENNILNLPIIDIIQDYKNINNIVPDIQNKYKASRYFGSISDINNPIDNTCCFVLVQVQEAQGE